MKKILPLFLVILIAAGIVIAGVLIEKNKKSAAGALKGFSVSPKSFQTQDYLEFFDIVSKNASVLTWAGNSKEFSNKTSAPYAISKTAKNYNLTPVIIAYPPDLKAFVEFAKEVKPEYLSVGAEVNRLHASELETLIKEFPVLYHAVKEVSPETKVFVSFQYENLKGLKGGLYGGSNTSLKSWDLLIKFPDSDLIGLTTYPGLIYRDPENIPVEHYIEISAHTNKPIAFIEIGWPSATEVAGWESSEEEQKRFVERFFVLTKDLNVEFFIWPFLYDQKLQVPFTSIGLIDPQGRKKSAFNTFVQ